MDRASALFFFEGYSDIGIGAQSHSIAFDICDQFQWYKVVMSLMAAFPAIAPRQLDAAAFNTVDCADRHAIRSDDFSVFLDLSCIYHGGLLSLSSNVREDDWMRSRITLPKFKLDSSNSHVMPIL
jgi:hypothetical protein